MPGNVRTILGKIADKKLAGLGFKKIEDSKYIVIYQRYNEKYEYVQRIDILHKFSGPALVQSYDPARMDKEYGNVCVGLTSKEVVAVGMKLVSKGW